MTTARFTVSLDQSNFESTLETLPKVGRWQVTILRFSCEPNAEYLLQLFNVDTAHHCNGDIHYSTVPICGDERNVEVGTASDLSQWLSWRSGAPKFWSLRLLFRRVD